jgi:hypothetical protein
MSMRKQPAQSSSMKMAQPEWSTPVTEQAKLKFFPQVRLQETVSELSFWAKPRLAYSMDNPPFAVSTLARAEKPLIDRNSTNE